MLFRIFTLRILEPHRPYTQLRIIMLTTEGTEAKHSLSHDAYYLGLSNMGIGATLYNCLQL
jgi:hypothetical protein